MKFFLSGRKDILHDGNLFCVKKRGKNKCEISSQWHYKRTENALALGKRQRRLRKAEKSVDQRQQKSLTGKILFQKEATSKEIAKYKN